MSKFNINVIGTAAGKTVNGTETLVEKVKTGVPAATHATKSGVKGKWSAVKAAYKEVRMGEDGMETVEYHDLQPAMLQLTEGK